MRLQSWTQLSLSHWKDWCWSWNSNTLATWWGELTHWKRPWCWERLRAGEGDDRGWNAWMASPTWWTWVWVSSWSWWWSGKRVLLQSMGRKDSDTTEQLNWTGLQPTRLLCPWGLSPVKNTGMGCHNLLQGNLPNPGTEPRSPALQADSLPSEPPGKPLKELAIGNTHTPHTPTKKHFQILNKWNLFTEYTYFHKNVTFQSKQVNGIFESTLF